MLAQLPGDQVVAFVLLDIAIILVVARLVGALALKIGQPRVVGEIVAGVLLGPSLLGANVFTWDNPWGFLDCEKWLPDGQAASITACFFPNQAQSGLNLLGQLALILFMFLVGLELNTDSLKGKGRGIITVAVGVVVIPILSAFLIVPALFNDKFIGPGDPSRLGFTLMVGAMLSVTAFPVAARILQEKKMDLTPFGAVGIASSAVVTILMFLAVGVAAGVASEADASTHVWRFVGAIVYLAVMWFVVRPLFSKLLVEEAKGKVIAGDRLAAVFIVIVLSAYVANRIGIHVIVGGFMAGIVLPRSRELTVALIARMQDIAVVFLLPIFLAFSGLKTDFTQLGWAWLPGLALFLVMAIASKWIGGLVSGKLGGLSWQESNAIGILMNCRGLLVLVVALVALDAGVINAQLQVGAVVMALVTTAMTGPLVDKFLPSDEPKAEVDPILTDY